LFFSLSSFQGVSPIFKFIRGQPYGEITRSPRKQQKIANQRSTLVGKYSEILTDHVRAESGDSSLFETNKNCRPIIVRPIADNRPSRSGASATTARPIARNASWTCRTDRANLIEWMHGDSSPGSRRLRRDRQALRRYEPASPRLLRRPDLARPKHIPADPVEHAEDFAGTQMTQ